MFIESTRTHLSKALASNISVITDTRLPTLSSVKISAGEIVEIQSTNIQNTVRSRVVEAMVKESGVVCVPAKSFYNIIKSLPGDRVQLRLNQGRLHVTSDNAKFGIAVEDPDNFPRVPEFPEKSVEFDREAFFSAINKTLFCACKDEARYHLCSVLFTPEAAVSTDGRRMSVVKGQFLPIQERALITRDTLGFITKIFKEGALHFAKVGSVIHFGNDRVTYSASLIAESFPDYKAVLPTGPYASIKVSAEFEKVVERASLISDDGVDLTFEDNHIIVSAVNAGLGESEESFPATIVTLPGKTTIRVRPSYLIEAMKVLESDTVLFELRDSTTSLIVLGENHVQAIMPIRR